LAIKLAYYVTDRLSFFATLDFIFLEIQARQRRVVKKRKKEHNNQLHTKINTPVLHLLNSPLSLGQLQRILHQKRENQQRMLKMKAQVNINSAVFVYITTRTASSYSTLDPPFNLNPKKFIQFERENVESTSMIKT
jgi:hypothetical protein